MDPKILLVEDNPDDVMLTKLAFRRAGVTAQLVVATDGGQALEQLQNGFSDLPPACVLLDIKLSTMSGLEVLAWMRQQPKFKRLPVLMLTSSVLPEDINRAYDLGANSYLLKPTDPDATVELARVIDRFWLRFNVSAVELTA